MLQKRKSQQEYKEHNQYGPGLGDQGEQIYVDDDDIQEITRSSMPPPSSIGKGKGISSRGSLGQGKHTLAERKGKAPGGIGGYFMPRTTPGAQPTLKSYKCVVK